MPITLPLGYPAILTHFTFSWIKLFRGTKTRMSEWLEQRVINGFGRKNVQWLWIRKLSPMPWRHIGRAMQERPGSVKDKIKQKEKRKAKGNMLHLNGGISFYFLSPQFLMHIHTTPSGRPSVPGMTSFLRKYHHSVSSTSLHIPQISSFCSEGPQRGYLRGEQGDREGKKKKKERGAEPWINTSLCKPMHKLSKKYSQPLT